MKVDWSRLRNPILPTVGRDPCLHLHEGTFRCFHTAVAFRADGYCLFLDVSTSTDLAAWTPAERLTTSELGFSSPGNILRRDGRWTLCLQSYPIVPGEVYGSEASRLWLMDSDDLIRWTAPRMIAPEGCRGTWTKSHRQIDPYLVEHDGRFWCFYKTSGCLGVLVSDDLRQWEEACPNRPVLSSADTPDGATVENPCVVRAGDEFVMFFSPCRAGRGIGVARSDDLLRWRDVRYLAFPVVHWAPGGPTAAMVVDWRAAVGCWVMGFHGESGGAHGAQLALARSADLETWECS